MEREWSPQTNYHIASTMKPWTHLILPQCDVTRRQTNEGHHVFFYIIGEVAPALAQNTPIEWFSSTPRLRLLSEI